MPKSFSPLAVNWIRFWIGLGLVGSVVFALLIWQAHRIVLNEAWRFSACANHTRTDCAPSPVWLENGWDASTFQTTPTSNDSTARGSAH